LALVLGSGPCDPLAKLGGGGFSVDPPCGHTVE
jgi:hypothetical protein